MPQPKERRLAVLYAKIKPSNKEFIRQESERKGYATISEYTDTLIDEEKRRVKNAK